MASPAPTPAKYPALFAPLRVGAVEAPNRVFMAPLTRLRNLEPGDLPGPLARAYYEQRAGAGILIAEAAQISARGKGYAGAPGMYTEEQVAAWKPITGAVHAKGGLVALQLCHAGRMSHVAVQPGNRAPLAPSAITSEDCRITLRDEQGNPERAQGSLPEEISEQGSQEVIREWAESTAAAREAGFDLVEMHAAHGYLLHQFLGTSSNLREDRYGGSIENRARLSLEALDAMIAVWSADRIGVRLSPLGYFQGTSVYPEQEEAALYLLAELARRRIAYVHFSEPDWVGGQPYPLALRKKFRAAFPGVIIGSGGYGPERAQELVSAGLVDAVAFGRAFIANPDLPERFRLGAELNAQDPASFYGGGAQGYTDYPALSPEQLEEASRRLEEELLQDKHDEQEKLPIELEEQKQQPVEA